MLIEITCNILALVDPCELIGYESSFDTRHSLVLKRVLGKHCSLQLLFVSMLIYRVNFKFDAESDVPLTAQEKKVGCCSVLFLNLWYIWDMKCVVLRIDRSRHSLPNCICN